MYLHQPSLDFQVVIRLTWNRFAKSVDTAISALVIILGDYTLTTRIPSTVIPIYVQ